MKRPLAGGGRRRRRVNIRGAVLAAAMLLSPVPLHSAVPAPQAALDVRTALIVIDLQNSILSRPTLVPVERVADRARLLGDAFRQEGLPVVLVRSSVLPPGRTRQPHRSNGKVDPSRSELLASLGARASDHIIAKQGWSAFSHTDLAHFLEERGVSQVVILGYSTSIGVESTARDAYDLGFNVTIVNDATTDSDAGVHAAAMEKIFPRLGEVVTTDELMALIDKR